jgi:hypothetical protein
MNSPFNILKSKRIEMLNALLLDNSCEVRDSQQPVHQYRNPFLAGL